jgi:hypothetical protein
MRCWSRSSKRSTDVQAQDYSVQQPVGLAVGSGHLFVAEEGPNRIKEFSLSGELVAIWTP